MNEKAGLCIFIHVRRSSSYLNIIFWRNIYVYMALSVPNSIVLIIYAEKEFLVSK